MEQQYSKQLTTLKRKFNKEETHALKFRKQGDIMNYLRKLKEAKRLRTEFHVLYDLQKNSIKRMEVFEDQFIEN